MSFPARTRAMMLRTTPTSETYQMLKTMDKMPRMSTVVELGRFCWAGCENMFPSDTGSGVCFSSMADDFLD
jgi:hypothetical protein